MWNRSHDWAGCGGGRDGEMGGCGRDGEMGRCGVSRVPFTRMRVRGMESIRELGLELG